MTLSELKKQAGIASEAVLNSYSILFFVNNRWMALAVLAASFLNFYAGLSGFIATAVAVVVAMMLGFNSSQVRTGIYSFNALITGIGLGTFFDPGFVFFVLLILASLLTLIISMAMSGWLFKYGLPYLSIPFVFTFWILLLPATEYANLGLTYRNIFWMNELYAIGGNSLLNLYQQLESMQPGVMVETYLRSLSSVFFQDNMIAGIIVATGLFVASRIFFSLSLLGFFTAYLFAFFVGSEAASITYYNIGANFIMVAIAVGGFFSYSIQSILFLDHCTGTHHIHRFTVFHPFAGDGPVTGFLAPLFGCNCLVCSFSATKRFGQIPDSYSFAAILS